MNCVQIYLTLALACHLIVAGCYASSKQQHQEYRKSWAAASQEEDAIDEVIQAMSRKVLQRANDQVGLSSMDNNESSARSFSRRKSPLAKLETMKSAEQFIRFIVTLVVPDVLKGLLNDNQMRRNLGLGRKLSSSSSGGGGGEKVAPQSAIEKAVGKWREGAKRPKLPLESGDDNESKSDTSPMGSLEAATKAGEQAKGIVPSSLIKPAGDQVKRLRKSMLGKNSIKQSKTDDVDDFESSSM